MWINHDKRFFFGFSPTTRCSRHDCWVCTLGQDRLEFRCDKQASQTGCCPAFRNRSQPEHWRSTLMITKRGKWWNENWGSDAELPPSLAPREQHHEWITTGAASRTRSRTRSRGLCWQLQVLQVSSSYQTYLLGSEDFTKLPKWHTTN